MRVVARLTAAAAMSVAVLAGCAPAGIEERIKALETQLAEANTKITRQDDIERVRYLAFAYGHYMDNALYTQVKQLFSKNIESCEISGYGVFKGYEGCAKIWGPLMGAYYGGDKDQIAFGRLVKHYLVKDLISVAPDGRTAHGRFDYFSQGGTFGDNTRTRGQVGVYNMDFVKEEDGIWRISKFWLSQNTPNYNAVDFATKPTIRCPDARVPPDGPSTFHHPFPEAGVIPFFDVHPVTGEKIPEYVNPRRYWRGNWPGEFGGPCGKIPGVDETMTAVTPPTGGGRRDQ